MNWTCRRCRRTFRQANQRHACGTGDAATLLRNRPAGLVALYRELEATTRDFGGVEIVTRDRYALFRTTRIFADLTVTRDALRVVVHLARRVAEPCFVKAGPNGRRISHVAFVRTAGELCAIVPFVREAFELSTCEA